MGSPVTIPALIQSPAVLTGYAAYAAQFAASLAAEGVVADIAHLWPVQSAGMPRRITAAGVPNIEAKYHRALEQGRFCETSLGGAMAWIQTKKLDLDEKIMQYLDLNQLAIDAKLPDFPRVAAMIKDSASFIKKVFSFISQQMALAAAIQADAQLLLAAEARMLDMIDANMAVLANLIAQICNWGLPSLPSLPMLLGGIAFPGFNLNTFRGFAYLPNLNFNLSATLAACIRLTGDPALVYQSDPANLTSLALQGVTMTSLPAQVNGSYVDPGQVSDPDYVATIIGTTDPIFYPGSLNSTLPVSIPPAESIASNYSLTPAIYAANICSICPPLAPIIAQPSQIGLQNLLENNVTLGDVVSSGFDPNLTAAWLFYLAANRKGRQGTWLPALSAIYGTLVQPSLDYLASTPVPWHKLLGQEQVSDTPVALPLIPMLQADTGLLKWRLSYVEASLLGLARNTTWDGNADATFTVTPTGTDLDYQATAVNQAVTSTVALGTGLAQYPVDAVYPNAIGAVLQQVIGIAAQNIAGAPSYQSNRPQFLFTYDIFAEAKLVDRYTQFWRTFNANLQDLLAGDSYVMQFAVSYPAILNSAINPLADASLMQTLTTDAMSRNRTWTPGSDLLPIPPALVMEADTVEPTSSTNGWSSGSFNSSEFLARPDIQAQPFPVQMAMLRTNQSYATLADMRNNVTSSVADAITNANAMIASIGMPGWQVMLDASTPVPSDGLVLGFPDKAFDQTGYVSSPSTITITTAGNYLIYAQFAWDASSSSSNKAASVMVNGVPPPSTLAVVPDSDPNTLALSGNLSLNVGDVLTVFVSQDDSNPQLLDSASFLGLLNTWSA